MKIARIRPRLGILFVLAVGIPSAALVVLAVWSIGDEEGLLKTRLERTYVAELDRVVAMVGSEMRSVQEELGKDAPVKSGADPAAALAAWKGSTDLVLLPFLLSAGDELVEPSQSRPLSTDELSFLQWNAEFLGGKVQTPILFNVAALYREEILRGETSTVADATSPQEPAAPDAAAGGAAPQESEVAASGEAGGVATPASLVANTIPAGGAAGAPPAPRETAATADRDRTVSPPQASLAAAAPARAAAEPGADLAAAAADATVQQQAQEQAVQQEALTRYKQDEEAQRRALDKAVSEGATPVERLVQPQANPAPAEAGTAEAKSAKSSKDSGAEQPSIFVSSQRTFKEIRAGATSGIVPRFVNDGLELLYWRLTDDGGTVGCLIDRRVLDQRLTALLPTPFSGDRMLVILDEHAKPLSAPPDGRQPVDWRRPFVAEELHETLPQWEAASYLADPALFASQLRMRVSLLWLLVGVLFASISGGGALVFAGLGAELRAAQQRTTFVANVSHELKTPLTSIRMFAEMLREGRQPDPVRRQRYLDCMVAESERLARLVNNVLDFSQLEQGRKRYAFREADLVGLCRIAVETERPRLEAAGFTVGFRALAAGALVSGDADAVRQVLANLMGNAEKYSRDTKSVEVEAGIEGGAAVLRVMDRGIGIAPEHAVKIFREFYRVDDSLTATVKGSGLGLSIARRIVRDHRGELSFRPRDGGGSVFEATLPLAGEAGA